MTSLLALMTSLLARVSFIEADDAVSFEQPVERRRAAPTTAGDFTDGYIGGRTVVTFTLSRGVPLGLTLEGGVDTSEPERGIRVQGVRKLCAAHGKLAPDDELLRICGASFWGLDHDGAVQRVLDGIRAAGDLVVEVARGDAGVVNVELDALDSFLDFESDGSNGSDSDEYV